MKTQKLATVTTFIIFVSVLIFGAYLINQKTDQINEELSPLMEEFAYKAKHMPYTVNSDGTLNFNGALDSVLAKRDEILNLHSCQSGEWRAEEAKSNVIIVKFFSFTCPVSLPGNKTYFLD